MFRKFICLMLCLCMVMSMLPVQVLAEMLPEEPAVTEETISMMEETTAPAEETTAPTEAVVEETTVPVEEPVVPGEGLDGSVTGDYAPEEDEVPPDFWEPEYDEKYGEYIALKGYCGAGENGVPGENLSYTLYYDGHLVIKGSGAMMDYEEGRAPYEPPYYISHSTAPWDYKQMELDHNLYFDVKKVTLPEGLTHIGAYAFYLYVNRNEFNGEFSLPKSVRSIGDYAFSCSGVEKITMPANLEEIGEYAFEGCGIQSIVLPKSLTKAGQGVFSGCIELSSVTISEGITEIYPYMFEGCKKLESITMPASVKTIGSRAFAMSGLTSITIPAAVEKVQWGAFSSCTNLETVEVLGADTVFDDVFWGVPLKNVIFGEGITKIPNDFFYGSAIERYEIQDTIIEIGSSAFSYCKSLREVIIPEGVETIGYQAFRNSAIKSLDLPDSVEYISSFAFFECEDLEEISIPYNATMDATRTFEGCKKLKHVTLPRNLTERNDYTILDSTFYGCESLESVVLPDTLECIGNSCFGGCRSLKEINLPKGLKKIYSSAFGDCDSLRRVVLPTNQIGDYAFSGCDNLEYFEFADLGTETYAGAISIGFGMFSGCRNLRTVVIPDQLTWIGSNAFEGCESLETICYGLSEESWNKVKLFDYPGNEVLANVTVRFNGEMDGGSCGDSSNPDGVYWSLYGSNELCIMGSGDMMNLYLSASQVPWSKYADQVTKITVDEGVETICNFAFTNFNKVTEVELPSTLRMVFTSAFAGCYTLEREGIVYYNGSVADWEETAENFESGNEPLLNAELSAIPIVDYTDNQNITVNYKGSAVAYYQTIPGESVVYRFDTKGIDDPNDRPMIAHSNKDGIFCIELQYEGNKVFSGANTYPIDIYVYQVGDTVFKKPVRMEAKVKVTPLSFSQSWTLSTDRAVGGKLTEGGEIGIGPLAAEATMASIGIKGSMGRAINITRGYKGDSESLELTSDVEGGVSLEIGAGITGDIGNLKLKVIEGSREFGLVSAGTYGLKTENYSPGNLEQQQAVATFFLGEFLMTQACGNTALFDLYNHLLAKNVYENSGCTYIHGGALKVSVDSSVDLLGLEVEGADLYEGMDFEANLISGGGKTVLSTEYRGWPYTSNFEAKIAMNTENTIDLLPGSLKLPVASDLSAGIESPMVNANLRTHEVELEYQQEDSKSTIGLNVLHAGKTGARIYQWGKPVKSYYEKFTLDVDSLKDLDLKEYSDDKLAPGISDVVQTAQAIVQGKVPVQYESTEKSETVNALKFALSFGAGVALDGEIAAAYKEGTEYTNTYGFVLADGVMPISQSDDLSQLVEQNKRSFWDIYYNAIVSVASDVAGFFKVLVAAVAEGIRSTWYTIAGNPEAAADMFVSTASANDEGHVVSSYTVSTCGAPSDTFANSGIRADNSNSMKKSRTIGCSVIVSVYRSEPENVIEDFSETPLSLTLRYGKADLEAAGLTKTSDTVVDGGIAIYRYNDDGDYHEYIGGENDLDDMSVTAQITRPGQYILAVDACAPELSSLDLSDYRSTPTITAFVDDMSGLDTSRFVFKLDDKILVDGTNVADHYDATIGKFTYQIPANAPLTEGKHTMSFTLADTSGNSETYDFSFFVDLTAPVIEEYSVNGFGNKGSVTEIRAKVNDANLTGVQALFSKLLSDGTWSMEVPVDMVQLADGTWALDYVGEGSVVKVRIVAKDIGEHTAETEAIQLKLYVEAVEIAEEYLMIRQGNTVHMTAEAYPVEFAPEITWSVDNESIITVDETGLVTAKAVGTAYVIATITNTDDGTTVTDRCRIDVSKAMVVKGIQLASTKATSELYSTDYAELEVLLQLPQNNTIKSVEADSQIPEDLGVAIEDAKFADENAAKYFDLIPQDDRTIAIVPTDYAVRNPGEVKGSYKSAVIVTVAGKEHTSEVLALTVKKSTPKLKVSIPAFNSFYDGQSQDMVITGGTVTEVNLDASKTQPNWLTLNGQTLTLNEKAPAKSASGKAYLQIWTEEWRIPAAITLTVKNTYKAATLKLSASTVTLNTAVTDKVTVTLTANPADFDISSPVFQLMDSTGKIPKDGELLIGYGDGKITIEKTEATKGDYKLYVGVGKTSKVVLTIKTISKTPTVSFKVSGNPDLNIPDQKTVITPTLKDYSGDFTLDAVTAINSKKADATAQFVAKQEGKTIAITCKEGTAVGTYTLTLKLKLADGTKVKNTAKVTVKQTALKLKLSASGLTLNKAVLDQGEITITSATKGYTLSKPVWTLMDKSGNIPANGKLDISWNNGKLAIGVNEATEYGATYKLLVKANDAAPASTITIKVLEEKKSTVTASIAAKGNIDVIRDGSAITITPAFKNVTAQTSKTLKLQFTKTINKVTTDATELFDYTVNANGIITVIKAEGAKPDHSAKYQVKLVATINGKEISSKAIPITVKQGSAKITLKADSNALFSQDKNDRIEFRLNTTDATLNEIAKIEIKDAKYADMLEVIRYGNGHYAIGFKDGKVDKSLVGKTITVNLNIYIAGNQTAKANTTAALKMTVLK